MNLVPKRVKEWINLDILGIPIIVEKLGGKVTEIIPIDDNKGNPLNPTACYIIEPLKFLKKARKIEFQYSVFQVLTSS